MSVVSYLGNAFSRRVKIVKKFNLIRDVIKNIHHLIDTLVFFFACTVDLGQKQLK